MIFEVQLLGCGFSHIFRVELKDYHNVFQAKFDFTPWSDTSFSPTSSARSSFSKRSSCRVKAVWQIYHVARRMASNCSGVQVLHATNPGFFTNPRFWRNLFYCQTSIKLMSYVYSELKVFWGNGNQLQLWYFDFDWNQTEFPLPKYQTIPPFKNCWILLACIHTLTWQQGMQPFVAYH